MSKSDIFTMIASLPDTDARLDTVAAILDGSFAARDTHAATGKLLSMGDACKRLNVSRATLWRLLNEGRITAVEIRKGSRRISEGELARFAEGRAR